VFSDTHLDIFNTQTAEWVQSIGLKQSLPLNNLGNVVLSSVNDTPLIVYLSNIHTSKLQLSLLAGIIDNHLIFYFQRAFCNIVTEIEKDFRA